MNTERSHSRFGKWALIIGIVIVLNLFFNYALVLLYPAPQYPTFCPDSQVVNTPATKEACLAVGGQWTDTTTPAPIYNGPGLAPAKSGPMIPAENGYCDPTYTCQKTYDAASTSYEKNIFIILVVLGVVSIAAGLLLNGGDAVATGLAFGGVLSLIIASARYWNEAGNLLKVLILAIALATLIWLGIKKFK